MSTLCYCCFHETAGEDHICTNCGFDNSPNTGYPAALPYGTVLAGRYRTGKVLGQGGFGITYLAQDCKTGELAAIKEYFPEVIASRDGFAVMPTSGGRGEFFEYGLRAFLEEAQTLAQFQGNPNIVGIHCSFEENNTAYFVMDYVEGTSLQNYIRSRGGRIPWEEAVQLVLPVMDALSAVHAKGIIHRDVTPDNIFIAKDGTVKLLDFGSARYSLGDVSHSLDIVLKHGFAPKEQYSRHGRQGPYTDVYSVAATLYYAVTGSAPEDSIDRVEADLLLPPSSLGARIPREREQALLVGLALRPADRFVSIEAFRTALTTPLPDSEPGRYTSSPMSALSTPPKNAQFFTEDSPRHVITFSGAADPAANRSTGHTAKDDDNAQLTEAVRRVRANAQAAERLQREQVLPEPITNSMPAPEPTMPPVQKKLLLIPLLCAAAVLLLAAMIALPPVRYAIGNSLYGSGKYTAARSVFSGLGSYRDSADRACEAMYAHAAELEQSGLYNDAAQLYESIGSFSDSADRAAFCRNTVRYAQAQALLEAGDYESAYNLFASLGNFSNSAQLKQQIRYDLGTSLFRKGQYEEAITMFSDCINYSDSSEKIREARYRLAAQALEQQNFVGAIAYLSVITDYLDSAELLTDARYQYACQLKAQEDWDKAASLFAIISEYLDAQEQISQCRYHAAISACEAGNYEEAVEIFTDLGPYLDCKKRVLDAKYQYVLSHLDSENRVTSAYLADLVKLGYRDSYSLNKQYFSYTLSVLAINCNPDDSETILESADRNLSYLHFDFKMTGGHFDTPMTLMARIIYPNGGSVNSSGAWDQIQRGDSFSLDWPNGLNTAAGKLEVKIYIKGTNNCIGSASIRLA